MNHSPTDFSDPVVIAGVIARTGRCYELAGRHVCHDPTATLVHGRVQAVNCEQVIDHAWVRLGDGRMLEPTLDVPFPADAFARTFRPEVLREYTHDEVIRATLDFGHWGPWDGTVPPVEESA